MTPDTPARESDKKEKEEKEGIHKNIPQKKKWRKTLIQAVVWRSSWSNTPYSSWFCVNYSKRQQEIKMYKSLLNIFALFSSFFFPFLSASGTPVDCVKSRGWGAITCRDAPGGPGHISFPLVASEWESPVNTPNTRGSSSGAEGKQRREVEDGGWHEREGGEAGDRRR